MIIEEKKMKKLILEAVLTAVFFCISGSVFAVLSGAGTQASPYLIQSRADFDEFANPANAALYWASGIHTKLMCDPNLAGATYTQSVIAPDTSTNSGFQGTPFTGIFDGNFHTISNVTINQPYQDHIGLFGCVNSGGQVKNLGVINATIQGRSYVGGLVGFNYGYISSCYAVGAVSGTGNYVGGLVGNNYGTLTSCYATGSVTGKSYYVGGLVGYNFNFITSCYATGAVSGTTYVGGLVGYQHGYITSCYATGSVSGIEYIGGLVGINEDPITFCYATGSVSGTKYVGGLAGSNEYFGTITTCHATGAVSGDYDVGGLVGRNSSGSISACYATGKVSGTGTNSRYVGGLVGENDQGSITSCHAAGAVNGTYYVGGLVGMNYIGKVIRCYSIGKPTGTSYVGGLCGNKATSTEYEDTGNFWDKGTSGITTSAMGLGKTTAEMKTLSTFTAPAANWDFTTMDGDAADWMMLREGEDYPRLAWQAIYPGDIAGLYGVDMADLMDVVNHWLEQGCPAGCEQADIDGSGQVDLGDAAIVGQNWMKGR